jgi:hypothetical protein
MGDLRKQQADARWFQIQQSASPIFKDFRETLHARSERREDRQNFQDISELVSWNTICRYRSKMTLWKPNTENYSDASSMKIWKWGVVTTLL